MDYRELFAQVRQRPKMYGVEDTFLSFCTYLHGIDAGNDNQFLVGFREFLAVKAGSGTNLSWPGLILHLAFPEATSGRVRVLEDEDHNRAAVNTLFQCLDEFMERRSKWGWVAEIFKEYQQMFPGR